MWPMTAGRPPSVTTSTSRPSARSSCATASALRATCDWSKLLAETLGMSFEDFAALTTANFYRLFDKAAR